MDVDFTGFCRHYVEGVTIVVPATRRIPPQCLESKAKITNKMNHIIATFEARQADPKAIPLMLDLDGNIAESNAHNFFAVVGGKIYTPGSKNVLGGITRAVLGELSDRLDMEVEETNLTPYDCLNADEAFLTSTSPTIVPIKTINGVGFRAGRPRPRDPAAAQGLGRSRGCGYRRAGHQPHGRRGEGRVDAPRGTRNRRRWGCSGRVAKTMRPANGLKRYLYTAVAGLTMGAADVVPGVSGGTMAFIMGIYEELVDALKAFNWRLLITLLRLRFRDAVAAVPWRFLAVLGAGITVSLLVLAGPIGWLLDHHPVPLFAFFLGLVLASIVTVAARIRWSVTAVLCLLLGAGVAYWLVGLVPMAMPHDVVTLFLSGAAAVTAMILPGISGAFILLVLGQYEFAIDAVRDRDFLAILPLAKGAICGILPFVRILSWLLRRHHQITIALLIGFMVGSLRKIWPFKAVVSGDGEALVLREVNVLPELDGSFWLALGLCILGFLLVLALNRVGQARTDGNLKQDPTT